MNNESQPSEEAFEVYREQADMTEMCQDNSSESSFQ